VTPAKSPPTSLISP